MTFFPAEDQINFYALLESSLKVFETMVKRISKFREVILKTSKHSPTRSEKIASMHL
jgi:hypothetical protein